MDGTVFQNRPSGWLFDTNLGRKVTQLGIWFLFQWYIFHLRICLLRFIFNLFVIIYYPFNPFNTILVFLYLVKILENKRVLWCFHDVWKEISDMKWVHTHAIKWSGNFNPLSPSLNPTKWSNTLKQNVYVILQGESKCSINNL